MAKLPVRLGGNYADYIVDGDAEDDVDGDWIRVHQGVRTASVEVTLSDTASPVGAITVEGTNAEDPGAGVGVVLALTAAAGGSVVQSIAASVLDGVGAKHVFYSADLSVNCPKWIRARWARDSGGAADLLNVRMQLS